MMRSHLLMMSRMRGRRISVEWGVSFISQLSAEIVLPDELEDQLRRRMEERPDLPWDVALLDVFGGDISGEDPEDEEE